MTDIPQTSLSKLIKKAINASLKQVHTCLPAVIISINTTTHLIDVQVTIKRKLKGKLVLLPVLQGVPLRHLRTSIFSITIPVKVGDHVMLLCSERSIDTWLTEGGIQDPVDVRKFSLNDAFAIPNMYDQTEIISEPMDADNLQIKVNDGSGQLTLTPSGVIELNGNADFGVQYTALAAAFNDLLAKYNAHKHGASVTTDQPSSADITVAKLATIKVP